MIEALRYYLECLAKGVPWIPTDKKHRPEGMVDLGDADATVYFLPHKGELHLVLSNGRTYLLMLHGEIKT